MLLALLALTAPAEASGPEVWGALYDARLASSADRDPAAAVAIYETVLEFLAADDPIRGEMSYWLARELVLEGKTEAALELLIEAARFPEVHDRARTLRGELLAQRNRVSSLPFSATFEEGRGPLLRGWPGGDESDLQLVEEPDPGDSALAWSVLVSPGRDDFLAVALEPGEAVPEALSFALYSETQSTFLRVVFLDEEGARWTSRVLPVPADEWVGVQLVVSELIRADAPFSEETVDPTALMRLEIRDVTAFHSDVRGAHRIILDDIELR